MSHFPDHFSGHSHDYARFRPTYPAALFEWLAAQAPARDRAWDCGTGSGQAAVALAAQFTAVIATDASAEQVARAMPHARVQYAVAPAEAPGIDGASVDLVTAAQAFHWFDQERFFAAAATVLKPGGVLAIWMYRATSVSPDIDTIASDLEWRVLKEDWPGERRLVDTGYQSAVIPAPFEEFRAPPFVLIAQWTRDQYVGYVGTWSAVHRHRARTGADPLEPLAAVLQALWPENEQREVRWDLALRVLRRP